MQDTVLLSFSHQHPLSPFSHLILNSRHKWRRRKLIFFLEKKNGFVRVVQGRVVKLLLFFFFLWWSQFHSKNNKRSNKLLLLLLLSSYIYVVHGAVYTKCNLLFVFVCERHLVAKPKPASPPHRQRRACMCIRIFFLMKQQIPLRTVEESKKKKKKYSSSRCWLSSTKQRHLNNTRSRARTEREKWWVFLWPHLTSDSFTSYAIQLFSFSLFVWVRVFSTACSLSLVSMRFQTTTDAPSHTRL